MDAEHEVNADITITDEGGNVAVDDDDVLNFADIDDAVTISMINSGRDTTLAGVLVNGNQMTAVVGCDLMIPVRRTATTTTANRTV